ncbi:hypothetical protein SH449x_003980 [Pirellulaceae bacterium SH449]
MKTLLGVLFAMFTAGSFFAGTQVDANDSLALKPTESTLGRFMVTLSEYQIARNIPEDATESDILKVIREDKLVPIETIRLSVSNTTESSVKIGRVASVVAGKATTPAGVQFQYRDVQVGSSLLISLTEDDTRVIAKIQFEASRLQDEGKDENERPVITSTVVKTTQSIGLGTPCVLGASTADRTSYVVVLVNKLP